MLLSRCDSNKGGYAPKCGWVSSNQLKVLREKLRFRTEGNFLPLDYTIEIPYELTSLLDFPMDSELKMQHQLFLAGKPASCHNHVSQFLKVSLVLWLYIYPTDSVYLENCDCYRAVPRWNSTFITEVRGNCHTRSKIQMGLFSNTDINFLWNDLS